MNRSSVLLLIAGLLVPLPAAATGDAPWGTAGAWEVFVDTAAGNGCFMERELENGLKVRMGNLPLQEGHFLDVLSRDWTDIVEGEAGEVDIDFSDDLFTGEVVGRVDGEWYGGHIFTNNPEFLELFARRREMSVGETGMEMFTISLDGTSKGLDALRECQDGQPAVAPEK